MKFSIGTMISDENTFKKYLGSSQLPVGTKISCIRNITSASTGLNRLLQKFYYDKSDVGVFLHQDVFILKGWLEKVEKQLKKLDEDWLVAGVWGRNEDGTYHGNVFDKRVLKSWRTNDIFPMEVDCLDGLCLIFNLNYKISLSNNLLGWDPYDTYVCMLAKSLGLKVYVIDALLFHYCLKRSFVWRPDETFNDNLEILKNRFPGQQVVSTIWREN